MVAAMGLLKWALILFLTTSAMAVSAVVAGWLLLAAADGVKWMRARVVGYSAGLRAKLREVADRDSGTASDLEGLAPVWTEQ